VVSLPHRRGGPLQVATASVRIWEGESVDAVRELVEGVVGEWIENEYFEMQVDGLTSQLAS
jgi:hypothetical protein